MCRCRAMCERMGVIYFDDMGITLGIGLLKRR